MHHYNYTFIFLGLFAGIFLHAQDLSENLFSKKECLLYAQLLRNLSKKVTAPLESHIKNNLKKNDTISMPYDHYYYAFKSIHYKTQERCDVYKGWVRYSNEILYSDGRQKPGIEIVFEGPYTADGIINGHNLTCAQAQEKDADTYEYRSEFDPMIHAFERIYESLLKHERKIIRLDASTECEIYKRKKYEYTPSFVCRLTLPTDFFDPLVFYRHHDAQIFAPGLKEYRMCAPKKVVYDYKKTIADLLQKDHQDIETAMRCIRNHALHDAKLAAFLDDKKMVKPIIKQIRKKYTSHYPLCVAVLLGAPGSIAWAYDYVHKYPYWAHELSLLLDTCLQNKKPNLILACDIIYIINQVCDKDLLSKALVNASFYNSVDSITFLLKNGADIQFEKSHFRSHTCVNALQAAVYGGRVQAVQVLLAAGAKDVHGAALEGACREQEKYTNIADYADKYARIIEMLKNADQSVSLW